MEVSSVVENNGDMKKQKENSKRFNYIVLVGLAILCCSSLYAQTEAASTAVENEENNTVIEATTPINELEGEAYLNEFYKKLYHLEQKKQGRVSVVHIGDSHIQADLLTGKLRTLFQSNFGNAGLGFTFPYKLAKTNGNHFVRYTSNVPWTAYRNIYPINGATVGLSGIAFTTTQKDFALEVEVRESPYNFTKLKVFSPEKQAAFDVAISEKKVLVESTEPKNITHKIKHGESLSTIARKYKISVNQLKRANNLTTNLIRIDKVLKIPTQERVSKPIEKSTFTPIALEAHEGWFQYTSANALSRVYLIPHTESVSYNLNGLSLENDEAGVVYHNIGVNGARFSDYNKYPLFFEQLNGLEPDLIILSMGTNEAFDKMQAADFQQQVDLFVERVRKSMPTVEILITTPTPSLLPKKQPNTYAEGYADSMKEKASFSNYALWDAFHIMGGNEKVHDNFASGLLSRDFVHYSKMGYEHTADLLYEALMRAYANYKTTYLSAKDEL